MRFSNGEVELTLTLDFGPRIVDYRICGGKNVLGEFPERKIESEVGVFSIWGGHRLWIAPEDWPMTYVPDDSPVTISDAGPQVTFDGPTDPQTRMRRSITVELADEGTVIQIDHAVCNCGSKPVIAAPWALTIMRPGGVVEIPHEPFASHGPDCLLPVRTVSLWSYTQLHDARFSWGSDALKIEVDDRHGSPQKIGVSNRFGMCRYVLDDVVFIKKYGYVEGAEYPDFGVNTEIFSQGGFVEIETLAPLETLAPGETALHHERWSLNKL